MLEEEARREEVEVVRCRDRLPLPSLSSPCGCDWGVELFLYDFWFVPNHLLIVLLLLLLLLLPPPPKSLQPPGAHLEWPPPRGVEQAAHASS